MRIDRGKRTDREKWDLTGKNEIDREKWDWQGKMGKLAVDMEKKEIPIFPCQPYFYDLESSQVQSGQS